MSAIVVVDASVAFKWFHEEGEEEVAPARVLLARWRERRMGLAVLDLTAYEVGNAMLRGRTAARPGQIAGVLGALADICPIVVPDARDRAEAARLAARHGLTFYDASYAAVAQLRSAELATYDAALLRAGLGRTPTRLLEGNNAGP